MANEPTNLHEHRTGKEITQWADEAMFEAEPLGYDVNKEGPKVHLLAMSADPLGQIAAMAMMYEGKVVRDLSQITDDDRRHYFEQIKKTHLKAPFEAVSLHFMIDGVTRSFTHQMVRQRTAGFAQESLPFAVKDTIDEEVALPPSLRSLKDDDPRVVLWRTAVNKTDDVYHALVDSGVPAEDARGLLPHNITTRLNYVTNLRNLQDHAGMRLCTQAQFEWRTVWVRIVEAIRNYGKSQTYRSDTSLEDGCPPGTVKRERSSVWQFEMIADLFRPVCYLTGKCEFNASFDRACSIRGRVNANHAVGRSSEEWGQPFTTGAPPVQGDPDHALDENGNIAVIRAINPAEWLTDPAAAR